MGVYIKGMDMPENCFHCRFSRWDVEGGFCDLLNEDADMRFKRHDDCPLVECSFVFVKTEGTLDGKMDEISQGKS